MKTRRNARLASILALSVGLLVGRGGGASVLPAHDVDGDGLPTLRDVSLILAQVAGVRALTPDQMLAADVSPFPGTDGRAMGDGKIQLDDAIRYLRFVVGILPSLAAGSTTRIRPESEMVQGCVGWPATNFTPTNHAPFLDSVPEASPALDLTLDDVDGQPHRLADMLAIKPVLLVLGSYTCPSFRLNVPLLNQLASRPFDSTRTYSDVVQFVEVHTIEPHPSAPDLSPFTGMVSDKGYNQRQTINYDDRLVAATKVRSWLTGNQLLLVDEMPPRSRSNPVWCSYGPAANAAFLIGQDGVVRKSQIWLDVPSMRTAIDRLMADAGSRPADWWSD